MALKQKEKFGMAPSMVDLMEDDMVVALELSMLTSNIRKQVWNILDDFLSFPMKCEEKKAHTMLSLMLDARFKSFRLIFSFINQEQVVSIVENYDKQYLFPCLLKCHHVFRLVLKIETMANQMNDEILVLTILKWLLKPMS